MRTDPTRVIIVLTDKKMRDYFTHPQTDEEKAEKERKYNEDMAHIENVLATRRRLGGISNQELLGMDYMEELKK